MKGNVDLMVGVTIGGAFQKIVDFVKDMPMPVTAFPGRRGFQTPLPEL